MSAPNISVLLRTPIAGYANTFISQHVSLEMAPEITESIESPAEVNRFMAPEVSLRVYDNTTTPWARALFSQITPTSRNWYILIGVDGQNRFYGYILPNTVQIDDQELWVSFTAVGLAGLLGVTSADLTTMKRTVDTGWRVTETSGNEFFGFVTIENNAGAKTTCEIESGDTVTMTQAGGEENSLTVLGVEPVGDAPPYASFELSVRGMKQQYEAGTAVTLATPYVRNVAIKTAIDALYAGAGLMPTVTGSTYLAAGITGATAPFASPVSLGGLVGNRLGIARNYDASAPSLRGYWPVIGTDGGLYEQPMPPQGAWRPVVGAPTGPLRPVDYEPNGNGAYLLYGKRYAKRFTRSGGLGTPPDGAAYYFYAYDYSPAAAPVTAYRYVLKIAVDNLYHEAGTYNWDAEVYRESSSDYVTWAAFDGPWGATSGATDSNLHEELPLTCGIAILTLGGVSDQIYWTEPVAGSGSITYRLSMLNTSGFVVTAGVATNIRGAVIATSGVDLTVFQRDELRGNIPTAYAFSWSPGPGLAPSGSAPIPADVQPYTIKLNAGDGYYYALSASVERGVYLLSGVNGALGARSDGYVPSQLYPPSPVIGTVDLTVFRGDWPGSGPYPMMALFGNQVWYISFNYSGVIPYLDLDGLSCGDALAQLATLLDAFFWVDRLGVTWLKSRSIASGTTIGTSTRIDDDGCLSLRRTGIWYKAVRHVTVRNEQDEAIVGTAGDEDFAGSDLAIEISNRFVYPTSFAIALAQHLYAYLGRGLTMVDVEHVADGRDYRVGNKFTASIAGVVKDFQIIESTHRPAAGTVRVQGVEL